MLINNAAFVPENIVTAFQPMHNMMKMVSTINNNLAIRKDSFTRSAELEKQMRMAMLEEETKVEEPTESQGYSLASLNPIEARLRAVDISVRFLTQAKDLVAIVEKYETVLADENISDEQRAYTNKINGLLKEQIERTLDLSVGENIDFFSTGLGMQYDRNNNTNQFAKLVELTGDLSAKGLGLTGFKNMNSTEILEMLDGALVHLNEMGKLVSPTYTPPKVEPMSQKELRRYEVLAEHWDYIKAKLLEGLPIGPLTAFSEKI